MEQGAHPRFLGVLVSGLVIVGAAAATQGPGGGSTPAETPRQSAAAAGGGDGEPRSSGMRQEPRFHRNDDGTVTDNRTGLVWLQDASCTDLPRTDKAGRAYGKTAVLAASELAEPACGLADGSRAGEWRLPSRSELESLLALEFYDPALSNAAGTARWAADDPFSGVESTYYWTSTTLASDPTFVWCVDLWDGLVFYAYEVNYYYVWPVRGGL